MKTRLASVAKGAKTILEFWGSGLLFYGYPFPRRPRGWGSQPPPQAPGGRHPGRPGAASQGENRAAPREQHDFAHGPFFRGRAPSTPPQPPIALREAEPLPDPDPDPDPERTAPPWRPLTCLHGGLPGPRPAQAQDGDGHFRAGARRGRSPGRLRKVAAVARQRSPKAGNGLVGRERAGRARLRLRSVCAAQLSGGNKELPLWYLSFVVLKRTMTRFLIQYCFLNTEISSLGHITIKSFFREQKVMAVSWGKCTLAEGEMLFFPITKLLRSTYIQNINSCVFYIAGSRFPP